MLDHSKTNSMIFLYTGSQPFTVLFTGILRGASLHISYYKYMVYSEKLYISLF